MDKANAVIVFLGALGVAIAAVKLALRRHQQLEHLQRIWGVVAKRLGGRVESTIKLFTLGTGVRVTAKVAGLPVTITTEWERSRGQRASLITRVRAGALGLAGLRLSLAPEDLLSQVGKAFGAQDVTIGDEPFDGRYVIKATNEDLARAWLTEPIRRGIEACPAYRFELGDGEVRATFNGLDDDARRLEAVARFVPTFARGGASLLQATRQMAAEIGGLLSARGDSWEPDGGVLIVVDHHSAQVLVDFICAQAASAKVERVLTRVRARSLVGLDAHFVIHGHQSLAPPVELARLPLVTHHDSLFSERFTLLTDDAETMTERLSTSVRRRLQGLSPALVTGNGREVMVLLGGLVLEPAAVFEAIDLAVELALAEPASPYR